MKCYTIVLAVLFFAACSGGAGKTKASDSANATQAIINTGGTTANADANSTGASLIAANDCLTCHKIDEKNIGPSYRQIANKYDLNQGNIENLANKIIKGGRGLWGDAAMTPHAALTHDHAEEMVRYILSLRDTTK